LAELLDNTVQLASNDYDLKKHYDFREIEIVRRYDPDLPLVPCEKNKIQQVILNILKNGAQAMFQWAEEDRLKEEGRKQVFVLRVYQSGSMARIEIQDNGPGMDEQTCKRVFEPFFTTKEVGQGTGLGLSVSYFIVTENHGGHMEVVSELGQGTTFIIDLPLDRPKERIDNA
jgi:signal transduction histidine kinase